MRYTLSRYPEIVNLLHRAGVVSTYPDVEVSVFTHPINVNSYWDGGTKYEYTLVGMVDKISVSVPTTHPIYDKCGMLEVKELPPDCALIIHGVVCGKPARPHIVVRSDSLIAAFEAPKINLTDKGRAALNAIAGIKGGKYRRDEFDRLGLGEYGPKNQYVLILQSLGLVVINKVGSISVTVEGHNARKV